MDQRDYASFQRRNKSAERADRAAAAARRLDGFWKRLSCGHTIRGFRDLDVVAIYWSERTFNARTPDGELNSYRVVSVSETGVVKLAEAT